MAESVLKITGRRVLNPSFQLEASMFPRLVEDCPNCSSTDTKPLSYTAKRLPYSVYECRACAHVWRFLPADTARTAITPDRILIEFIDAQSGSTIQTA